MNIAIPGVIMVFREGLEIFLILTLLFAFLEKTKNRHLRKSVLWGAIVSIVLSFIFGFLLTVLADALGKTSEIGKIWESVFSLVAVGMIVTFIFWMITHSKEIKAQIEKKAALHLSSWGLFFVSFVLILREGVEIVLFALAGKYNFLSIGIGAGFALLVSLLVSYSLVRINFTSLFRITLIYLILQAGYLLGYGIHESISALTSLGYLGTENILFQKAFNLSGTLFNHKEGIVGLPLNVLVGWYSKPEWIQWIVQYVFTLWIFLFWFFHSQRVSASKMQQKI